ncbi:branched chain amino acid ABC transporter substrate-binding protein [Candidatus Magnetomorum sp. HK-1]|nr:branched chain amino acid ABC transporter substrate-binding protein [Candidatus Magnetomorum sp. HK-1]
MKKLFNKKNVIIFLLLLFCSSLLGAGGLYLIRGTNKQSLYFGVGGPFTGKDKYYGREMIRGIDLCLEQVNANGGIDGKKLKYIQGDDMNIPNFAMKIASYFAKKNVLFVLGHYTSQTSFSAGRIYMKEGVPAVTASASADNVTNKNEWYFRTSHSATNQANLIVSFSSNQLNIKSALIIYSKDIFGRSFKDAFTNVVPKVGIKIENVFHIDFEKSIQDQIFTICKKIKELKYNGVIFLAIKADIATQLIKQFKLMNINVTIIGTDSVSNESFYHAVKDMPLEKAIPGYYSDGIMATGSDIFGNHLFNEASAIFYKSYYNSFKAPPSSISAEYYDATLTMVEVLRQIETDEDTTTEQFRRLIRHFLADINKPDYAVNGICGDIFFDNNGSAIKSIGLGQYQKGQLAPYHQQFILNMADDTEKSYLVESAFHELSIVKVKTNICDLDIKETEFTAHLIFKFIYKNSKIDLSDIVFLNTTSTVKLGQPIEEYTTNGFIHKTYDINATFKRNVNYEHYPFDRQKLAISFKHPSLNKNEIRFSHQGFPQYNFNDFNFPGWKIRNTYSYGLVTNEKNDPFFNIFVNISREFIDLLVKILVPGVVILCLLFSIYIICPSICTNSVIILITCLGLNSFLYVNLKDIQVSYTTLYDKWFIFLYMMICISLLMVFVMSFLKRIGGTKIIIWVKLLGGVFHLGGLGYLYYVLRGLI